ncbi:hypothetical protein ACFCX0_03570 [Streptomyces sp. NPDC056352]|uniref:hypothetical protein n=1 Tax=Streptomyces sp. NPDC056352 TaxID=3345791 RepID=UPI0035D58706
MTVQADAVTPGWWPNVLRGIRRRRAFTGLLLDNSTVAYDGQLHVHFADRATREAYQNSDSHLILDAALQATLGESVDINYTCGA